MPSVVVTWSCREYTTNPGYTTTKTQRRWVLLCANERKWLTGLRCGSLAIGGNSTPLAMFKQRVILCDKAAPQLPSPAAPTCVHALGSLSHFMVGHVKHTE